MSTDAAPLAPADRADLEEAIRHLAATAARLPSHFVDKRAELHDRINVLLTLRELAE